MPDLPIHPAVVHVPLALSIVVPWLAIALAVWIGRGGVPARAWWLVVALQVVTAGGAFTAVKTGEKDAEKVGVAVPAEPLEEHEEAAEWFAWSTGIALAFMLAPAFVGDAALARWLRVAAIAAALVSAAAGVRTGLLGGQLVYVHGAAAAHGLQQASPEP